MDLSQDGEDSVNAPNHEEPELFQKQINPLALQALLATLVGDSSHSHQNDVSESTHSFPHVDYASQHVYNHTVYDPNHTVSQHGHYRSLRRHSPPRHSPPRHTPSRHSPPRYSPRHSPPYQRPSSYWSTSLHLPVPNPYLSSTLDSSSAQTYNSHSYAGAPSAGWRPSASVIDSSHSIPASHYRPNSPHSRLDDYGDGPELYSGRGRETYARKPYDYRHPPPQHSNPRGGRDFRQHHNDYERRALNARGDSQGNVGYDRRGVESWYSREGSRESSSGWGGNEYRPDDREGSRVEGAHHESESGERWFGSHLTNTGGREMRKRRRLADRSSHDRSRWQRQTSLDVSDGDKDIRVGGSRDTGSRAYELERVSEVVSKESVVPGTGIVESNLDGAAVDDDMDIDKLRGELLRSVDGKLHHSGGLGSSSGDCTAPLTRHVTVDESSLSSQADVAQSATTTTTTTSRTTTDESVDTDARAADSLDCSVGGRDPMILDAANAVVNSVQRKRKEREGDTTDRPPSSLKKRKSRVMILREDGRLQDSEVLLDPPPHHGIPSSLLRRHSGQVRRNSSPLSSPGSSLPSSPVRVLRSTPSSPAKHSNTCAVLPSPHAVSPASRSHPASPSSSMRGGSMTRSVSPSTSSSPAIVADPKTCFTSSDESTKQPPASSFSSSSYFSALSSSDPIRVIEQPTQSTAPSQPPVILKKGSRRKAEYQEIVEEEVSAMTVFTSPPQPPTALDAAKRSKSDFTDNLLDGLLACGKAGRNGPKVTGKSTVNEHRNASNITHSNAKYKEKKPGQEKDPRQEKKPEQHRAKAGTTPAVPKKEDPRLGLSVEDYPLVPLQFGTYVNATIRQQGLHALLRQMLQKRDSRAEAIALAVRLEGKVYDNCKSKYAYRAIIVQLQNLLKSSEVKSGGV